MNDNKINSTNATESKETVYERLVREKQELDEKIVKLNEFLSDWDKSEEIVGHWQVSLLESQLESMLEYSSVLNSCILRWKK